MDIVDLHVHSNKSDGSKTPSELVDYAITKGLSAFALTDHDTIDGLEEAMTYALNKPITVIPGIELSTEYEGKDIHILGLMIDYKNKTFKEMLSSFVHSRDNRNKKMCKLLCDAGISVPYDELLQTFPDCVITRAHYARFMVSHGYVSSNAEAFERYIGDHAPYFVGREKISPEDAIQLILNYRGIPVLAHPTLYHFSDERLHKLVSFLKDEGLVGIEAIYTTYSAGEEKQMKEMAKQYDLLISGGSDYHGAAKPKTDLAIGHGNLLVPAQVLTALINYQKNKGINI